MREKERERDRERKSEEETRERERERNERETERQRERVRAAFALSHELWALGRGVCVDALCLRSVRVSQRQRLEVVSKGERVDLYTAAYANRTCS